MDMPYGAELALAPFLADVDEDVDDDRLWAGTGPVRTSGKRGREG